MSLNNEYLLHQFVHLNVSHSLLLFGGGDCNDDKKKKEEKTVFEDKLSFKT
jgi:hypothetical protein